MTKTTESRAEPFRAFAIRDSIFFRLADFALLISVLVFIASVVIASVVIADEGTDFFEAKIRPVLVEHCYQCHSAQAANAGKLKGGLQLDTCAGIRTGGDSGPASFRECRKRACYQSQVYWQASFPGLKRDNAPRVGYALYQVSPD